MEPALEFLILLHQTSLLKAFIKNNLAILKTKAFPILSNTQVNILSLSLYRMLFPVRKSFIHPISILFLFLLGVFLFIQNTISFDKNIFLLYYYSIFPSVYYFLIKKIIDKTDFLAISELSNYYYMKKFALRNKFVKEFSKIIFKNTLIMIVPLLIPIFFLKSLAIALVINFLALVALKFSVYLCIFQKTTSINNTIEDVKLGFLLNPLEMVEDFFVIGSATYLSSFALFYYIKHKIIFLTFLFPTLYFSFVIFYTFMKGWLIRVKNQ